MPQSSDAYLWKTKRNRSSHVWNQYSSQLLGCLTIFIWLGSSSMKLYSAQVISTSTKPRSKVHLKPLGRHSWSLWRVAPIHVFISQSEGVQGDCRHRRHKEALTEGLKAPGTHADLEAALWWEAGFTISDTLTQAGVCFFSPQQMILQGLVLQWLDLGQEVWSLGVFWHLLLCFETSIWKIYCISFGSQCFFSYSANYVWL